MTVVDRLVDCLQVALLLCSLAGMVISFSGITWEIAHLRAPFGWVGVLFASVVVLAFSLYPALMPRPPRGGQT